MGDRLDISRLNYKPGDPLLARDLQLIVDLLRSSLGIVTGGGGVRVVRDARGNTQISAAGLMRFVGKASGAIPAASGAAWGAGVVTRYQVDASHDESSLSVDYDVLNPSATTMSSGNGIDDGQRCLVEELSDGTLIVSPLECS